MKIYSLRGRALNTQQRAKGNVGQQKLFLVRCDPLLV